LPYSLARPATLPGCLAYLLVGRRIDSFLTAVCLLAALRVRTEVIFSLVSARISIEAGFVIFGKIVPKEALFTF
jgi:hypothetical protein